MEELSELLEEQLSKAVEVKDPQYLRKYAQTLSRSLVEKTMYENGQNRVELEIKELTTEMKNGFSLMGQRFESMQKQMDERFEASDKRFSDMHRFMSLGFTALALLIAAFNIVLILVK